SLLYAFSGDQAIPRAFRGAVHETMREIEAEMKTRVRQGRQNTERPMGNMVWAEFIHLTSWPVNGIWDPQLQAYLFVLNETSRWTRPTLAPFALARLFSLIPPLAAGCADHSGCNDLRQSLFCGMFVAAV